MHYAPRRLREEPEQRLAAADDIRALREKRPETVGRTISPLAPQPALAWFLSLLASGDTPQAAEREQPEKESDKVLQRFLQQFLQWRQKANLSEAAQ